MESFYIFFSQHGSDMNMNTHEGVTFFFPNWIKGRNRRNGKFPVQKIPWGRVFQIALKVGRGG